MQEQNTFWTCHRLPAFLGCFGLSGWEFQNLESWVVESPAEALANPLHGWHASPLPRKIARKAEHEVRYNCISNSAKVVDCWQLWWHRLTKNKKTQQYKSHGWDIYIPSTCIFLQRILCLSLWDLHCIKCVSTSFSESLLSNQMYKLIMCLILYFLMSSQCCCFRCIFLQRNYCRNPKHCHGGEGNWGVCVVEGSWARST